MQEELKVYQSISKDLKAQHQFRILGMKFLTLDYIITEKIN